VPCVEFDDPIRAQKSPRQRSLLCCTDLPAPVISADVVIAAATAAATITARSAATSSVNAFVAVKAKR